VRPTADRLNRSLEPDVLGDHHAVRTIRPKGAAATGPVHTLPASWGLPKSGIGIERGPAAPKIVDRSGVMKLIERRRTGGATVIMVCREAWSAWCRRAEGFPMDWSQCAS
jgi:hypothetical protein